MPARWRFAGCSLSDIRIHGAAFVVMALWILLVPLPWVAAALTAAVVHELGHLMVIWANGVRVWCVRVLPTGARIETAPMEPKTELWCALAGPFAGLLILLFWRWVPKLAVCALVQTVFNLVPIYPMDGGRVVRLLGELPRKRSCKVR